MRLRSPGTYMHGHPRVDHRPASVKPRMMKSKHSRLLRPVRPLLRLWAVWMLAAAAAGQRPDCPTSCGGVDIPFPFGIGKQCALHSGFELNCTTVNGIEKPFSWNLEVTNISVPDGKAWMKTFTSWQCYEPATGGMRYSQASMNFIDTPYWISEVDNKIIVIGCNALAYMMSSTYVIGCMSTCNNNETETRKNGVCQADVPKGIQYYYGNFNENYNTTEIWERNLCGYMALMEEEAFEFKPEYLQSTVFNDTYNEKVPVVLNWQIRPWTCDLAKENSSYACVSSNSECLNTTNEPGYRCRCSDGYTGNPYITDGCTDIDECLDNVTYPCPGVCENTLGGFTCSCSRGGRMVHGACTQTSRSRAMTGLLLGLGVGSGMSLLSLVLGVLLVRQKIKGFREKKLRAKHFEQNRGLLLQQLVDKDIAERMIFSLEEIEKATNKFDEARKLGSGGHGTVYKGILSSQHVVAIKKSKNTIQREIDDFINEVAILSQVNHRNVVTLFGCCLEIEVPMLVYEFISNGTLSNHLHVEGPQSLSWEDRLRIALETASALAYLHSSASISVIHRDVKSDNILLDDRLTAKVSDFGASRGIPINEAGVTTVIQGTFGYLDPEYYQTSRLTEKSDVYSFGVILVELLTRKKPTSLMPSGRVSLIGEFNLLMSQDKLFEILDPQVLLEGAKDAEVVAALAAICISLNGDERPTMKQVEMRLQRLLVQENNTRQLRKVEQSCTATQIRHDEDNDSSKHNNVEQLALLSTSLPR